MRNFWDDIIMNKKLVWKLFSIYWIYMLCIFMLTGCGDGEPKNVYWDTQNGDHRYGTLENYYTFTGKEKKVFTERILSETKTYSNKWWRITQCGSVFVTPDKEITTIEHLYYNVDMGKRIKKRFM